MTSHISKNTPPTTPSAIDKLAVNAMAVLAMVLVLLPFHALLTVGYAALVGHYDLLRLWKELLLLLLLPVAGVLVFKTPGLRARLAVEWKHWLFWCIGAYIVLHVVLGLVALAKGQVNSYALVYAWVINLRLFLVFGIAYILASRSGWLRDNWQRWLVWPAVVVVGFGLLQIFVLPSDFLRHFGYGLGTILPYETVDQKLDYIRVQSTLRGANPLGAYLVLVLTAVMALLLKEPLQFKRSMKRDDYDRRQIFGVILLSAGLLVLVDTYSRSAYAGMVAAALALAVLAIHGRKAKVRLAWIAAGIVVLAAGSLVLLRDNSRFQNTFFHTDDSSQTVSSTAEHASHIKQALSDVAHEPFGRGPGTAGPASVHNRQPARIAENYYLQIAQETGWLGLGLFIAIIIGVGQRLYRQRNDTLGRTLLASLVGICVVNLALHAWTDDTLALLWWGLAGIALAIPTIPAAAGKVGNNDGRKE
jgi:hypothetical protein